MSALINLTLFGTVIAISTALALKLTPGAAPRLRYVVALGAFFAAALLPFLTGAERNDGVGALPPAPAERAAMQPVAVPRPQITIAAPVRPLGDALFFAWASIAALLVARELAGQFSLRRARRTWRSAGLDLRRTLVWPERVPLFVDAHDGPSTSGILRSAVVLPLPLIERLSSDALRQIARHELAHAEWRDPLAHAIVRMVRAVLWPSVPLWFLSRVIHDEREAAADRAAVESSSSAAEYAASLVAVAAWSGRMDSRFSVTATHISSAKGLEMRIERLFHLAPRLTFTRIACSTLILAAGILCTGFLPAAADEVTQRPDRLFAMLQGRDWRMEGELKEALAEIRRSGAIEPVVAALTDADAEARMKAAWVLGQVGDRRAVEPLLAAWKIERGEGRETMMWALGMIGDESAVEPLLTALGAPSEDVRRSAAWSLGEIGERRTVDVLIAALRDESSAVRHAAAHALGRIGDARAADALRRATRDENRLVREKAEWALGQLQ